ncbi:rhomboid family intramembrane serine protease [soil metagenome]
MVIPIGDDNPTRRRPWVCRLLILANVAVFVFLTPWSGGVCEQLAFYLDWAVVPAELVQGHPLGPRQLASTPAAGCGLGPSLDKDVYATLATSLFLHGGWLHLLGNMLYLWVFGDNVEDRYGHLAFLVFYLLSGVVATLAFALPNAASTSTLVGASGAIAAVLGAYMVLFPRAWVRVAIPFLFFLVVSLPAVLVLGVWFLLQLQALRPSIVSGGGVAYLAHVGGFVAGIAITLGFARRRPPVRRSGVPPGW